MYRVFSYSVITIGVLNVQEPYGLSHLSWRTAFNSLSEVRRNSKKHQQN
jgi:hypothetical protein